MTIRKVIVHRPQSDPVTELADSVVRSIHVQGRLILHRHGRCVAVYEPGEWTHYVEQVVTRAGRSQS